MPIPNIHKIDQPRERLEKYGAGKLSDEELLAIILRTGPKGLGVLGLAKKVLREFKETRLAQATAKDLQTIKGLGPSKACEIVATFELGRRLLKDKQSVLVLSPRQLWEDCKDLRGQNKEHFIVFYLDTQNQLIKREIISIGTLNSSLIHPREVFEPAVKHLASHIIVAHNHPSGSLEPSDEDIAVTKRLQDAGRILGIHLIDHIILTAFGYASFKEKNLL